MRKGFTLTELLTLILVIAGAIFIVWATFKGTPDIRLMTGIALCALYLPATIAGIIHHRMNGFHPMCIAVGALLIASKFVFAA